MILTLNDYPPAGTDAPMVVALPRMRQPERSAPPEAVVCATCGWRGWANPAGLVDAHRERRVRGRLTGTRLRRPLVVRVYRAPAWCDGGGELPEPAL